jgi:hypothetical protein
MTGTDKPGRGSRLAGRRAGGILSPRFLLELALVFALSHLLLKFFGLREYTTFLSGTMPEDSSIFGVFLGALYVIVYFLYVVATPVLLIAAAISAVVLRAFERKAPDKPGE